MSRVRLCVHGDVKVRFSMGTKLCGERRRARSSLADVSSGHSTAFLGSKTKIKKFGPARGLSIAQLVLTGIRTLALAIPVLRDEVGARAGRVCGQTKKGLGERV